MLESRVVPVISLVRNLGVDAAILSDVGYDLTIRVSDNTSRDDRIIVEVGYDLALAPSVTDSQGNTYQDDSLSASGAIFSAQDTHPLGPGDVITVHFNSVATLGTAAASASEWHGLAADPLDRTAYGFGGLAHGAGPNVSTSPTDPTSQPDELLIGAVAVHPLFAGWRDPSLSPGFDYQTLPGNDVINQDYYSHPGVQGAAILPEYRIVNAVDSYVADGVITPDKPDSTPDNQWDWQAYIATYKAAPDQGTLAAHFDVVPEHTTVAPGAPFSVTVIAKDDLGNVLTNYTGTVHFTSSDPAATLPPDYAFTLADAGQHTFVKGVTLRAPGAQTITAQDVVVPTVAGSSTVQVASVVTPTGTSIMGVQVMESGKRGRSMALLVSLSADVDPTSAQDLSHYALFSSAKGHPRRQHVVPLVAALYDPGPWTVILVVGKRKATDRRATLVVLGLPGQADLFTAPVPLGPARRR
jgi:hypothetical protein